MALLKLANYAKTAVGAALSSGATTLNVASSVTFPVLTAGQYFYATLIDVLSYNSQANPPLAREIIKVTATVGNVWTIVRGQDSTVAQSWSVGDVIEIRLNAQAIADLQTAGSVFTPVENFGAVGDNTVDDTAAIQAAFVGATYPAFTSGKTYKVTDTVFLSHPSFATLVAGIFGNGATINFTGFARLCSDDLLTTIFGFCSGTPSTASNFAGWQGSIDDLNFQTSQKLVMLGGSGCKIYGRNCKFTALGVAVKGCVLMRNDINVDFQNCLFDMRNVCTDTTGSRSFFTATYNGVNQNIPSSFGVMFFGYAAQVDTLGRAISPVTASNNFSDSFNIRECLFAGGQTSLLDGGTSSHQTRVIIGNEFAFNGYGIITNAAGTIQGNWFENTASACLRTVAGGPPWYAGLSTMPLTVVANSFSPHNGATAMLLDAIPNDSLFAQNTWGDFVAGGTFVNVGASGLGNRAWWVNNTNQSVAPGAITGLSSSSVNTAFTIIGGTTAEDHANPVSAPAFNPAVKTITGTTTLLATDEIVFVDGTLGPFTVTLPAANVNGATRAKRLVLKRIDATALAITIAPAGADTIDLTGGIFLPVLEARELISNGVSKWGLF